VNVDVQQNYAQQLDDNSDDDNEFEGYVDHAVGDDNSRFVLHTYIHTYIHTYTLHTTSCRL
jgi:hypothetical protein